MPFLDRTTYPSQVLRPRQVGSLDVRRIGGTIGNLRSVHHRRRRRSTVRRNAGAEQIVVDFRFAIANGANFFRHPGGDDATANCFLLVVGRQCHGGRRRLRRRRRRKGRVFTTGMTHHFFRRASS